MKKILFALTIIALGLPALHARTWTQAETGNTLEGELTEVADGKATIIMANGQSAALPIEMLTAEDKTFIEDWQKEKMAATEVSEGELPPLPEEDIELVLAGAHLCCGGCRKAVEAVEEDFEDVRISASDGNIIIKTDDPELANDAVAAIAKAGFYGSPSHQIDEIYSGTDRALASKQFTGLHLCCGKCVSTVEDVLGELENITSFEIDEDAGTVDVSGTFTSADVIGALQAAGMNARP